MGNKAKVQLVGARVATIDLDATQGSRIGTDLLLPDGTLANATNLKAYLGISESSPSSQQLMWEAIYNVPANVQQVALLATAGVVVRVSGTSWLTRTITGTAGLISVTNGSGVSANPTITIPDQNANIVLAGPTTGAAAAPTFRSIVLADLPTITYAYGGTGFTTYATGDIIYASATNTLSKLAAGTNTYVLTMVAGVPAWAASAGGGSTPTGTGFRHITAGVEDAAASLVYTADIAADQVTYAKIQNVSAASKLLGRGSASGSGDVEEITLGTNLSMSGTTLNASGGGGGGAFARTASSAAKTITSTTIPADNTIPQNTEGEVYAALDTTITPNSASSKLLITISLPYVTASTTIGSRLALFRDSGANAVFAAFASIATTTTALVYQCVVDSNAASATTFALRMGVSGGTLYINRDSGGSQYFGGVFTSMMTIQEVG